MAECIVLKGGGGIGSDELTATKDYVLNEKTYVGSDTNDEIGAGTMPDMRVLDPEIGGINSNYPNVAIQRPKTTTSIQLSDTTVSKEKLLAIMPKTGYYNSSYVGAPLNTVASVTGVTPAKVLAGQTACGVSGTATSDANVVASNILSGRTAYANGSLLTGTMPNYGSTPTAIDAIRINNNRFEVAVASGYHGYSWANNGYEYMTYDQVANAIGLTAAKLKKGETVCGRTGTFEGYIAGSLDLYNRGAWGSIASSNLSPTWTVQSDYTAGTLRYDSAQIALVGNSIRYSLAMLITKGFNTINYSYFNVTMLNAQTTITQFLRIECGTGYQASSASSNNKWEITNRLGDTGNTRIGSSSETTISLNLANINSTVYFLLSMYPNTGISSKDFAYIKRIWFS